VVLKVDLISRCPSPEDLVLNPIMGTIKILIADDQAVKKAQESNPDLIVLDITMPEMNGLDVARKIKEFAPDTPIVILTVHKSKQLMEEAKIIGVRGYVTKAEAGQNLLSAIDAVLRNQTFFPTNI
jgi:DNA-binding NarL/FixJ family response regulator